MKRFFLKMTVAAAVIFVIYSTSAANDENEAAVKYLESLQNNSMKG